jgi:hypothetical protein
VAQHLGANPRPGRAILHVNPHIWRIEGQPFVDTSEIGIIPGLSNRVRSALTATTFVIIVGR